MMGAAKEAKTPKAVIQLALAVAFDKSAATPETIVDHEQIRRAPHFEAIAKARDCGALESMWKLLSEGVTAEEFERLGYGTAIRRRALDVLRKKYEKDASLKATAGDRAKRMLESLINTAALPPRPGQVITPPAKKDESATTTKAKRARKKAANA